MRLLINPKEKLSALPLCLSMDSCPRCPPEISWKHLECSYTDNTYVYYTLSVKYRLCPLMVVESTAEIAKHYSAALDTALPYPSKANNKVTKAAHTFND